MPNYTVSVAKFGGDGGGHFSHKENLSIQGFQMGCGNRGAVLTSLHVENWQVLSRMHATYTSHIEGVACKVSSIGNIKVPDKAVNICILPHERVVSVSAEYGFMKWAAGANCLNYISITTKSVLDGSVRTSWCGNNSFTAEDHVLALESNAASTKNSHQGRLKAVKIPPGCTLAGLSGRAGDSWDQVVLHICPFTPGGRWSRNYHKHYVEPFKQQVRTLLLCLCRCSQQTSSMSHPSTTADAASYVPHLPPKVREELVAALFRVTFAAESTESSAGASEMCAANTSAIMETEEDKPCAFSAKATDDHASESCDYIMTWLQQYALQ